MAVLKMERPMDSWNDERLDEMSRRMDAGFEEMREGFARMVTREEMKELIATINTRFDQVDARVDRLENRVDRLYYACVALLVLLIGNSIASAWI
jgi:hypothetical protein